MCINQPPNDCWICHDSGDSVVLLTTKSSLISNVSVSLEETQPSLYYVNLSNPGGPFPYLCLTSPNTGNLECNLGTNKGAQGKGNQNKTTCVVYKQLNFTGAM